jgi:hypothetical protein
MSALKARAADRAREWEAAGALYEEAIAAGDRSLETLLDAALLYWQSTDGGLAAARFFGREFSNRAGGRPAELLADAVREYPTSTAARFWENYIASFWGRDFDVEDARQLLAEDPTELVPVLRIVMARGHTHELATEASELFRQSQAAGTARGRYVTSVISNALRCNGAWVSLTTKFPSPRNIDRTDKPKDWTSVRFPSTQLSPGFERAIASASRALWSGPWVTLYFWAADDPGPVEIGRAFELLRGETVVARGFVH